MYPQWVEEVCRTPCECHGVPGPDNIIAIGIARPGKGAEFMGPMAMVLVVCPNCGQMMNITVREPLKSVIAAMRHLVEVIDEAGLNAPPIDFSHSKTHPMDNPAAMNASGAHQPLRPSLGKNQPTKPPTQREIQAFLRRLRATSFKRGTKGFESWMKSLGLDPDARPASEEQ